MQYPADTSGRSTPALHHPLQPPAATRTSRISFTSHARGASQTVLGAPPSAQVHGRSASWAPSMHSFNSPLTPNMIPPTYSMPMAGSTYRYASTHSGSDVDGASPHQQVAPPFASRAASIYSTVSAAHRRIYSGVTSQPSHSTAPSEHELDLAVRCAWLATQLDMSSHISPGLTSPRKTSCRSVSGGVRAPHADTLQVTRRSAREAVAGHFPLAKLDSRRDYINARCAAANVHCQPFSCSRSIDGASDGLRSHRFHADHRPQHSVVASNGPCDACLVDLHCTDRRTEAIETCPRTYQRPQKGARAQAAA